MKILKRNFSPKVLIVLVLLSFFHCAPKEAVVFKGVKNIIIDLNQDGNPILKGDVFFFNPNKLKMKLKKIDVVVFVDGSQSAEVKHDLNIDIPGQSDFSVPITAQLTLKKEGGLLNTVIGLLGGKKYDVAFTGYIRVAVHGIRIKVPVSQKQEIKLR